MFIYIDFIDFEFCSECELIEVIFVCLCDNLCVEYVGIDVDINGSMVIVEICWEFWIWY